MEDVLDVYEFPYDPMRPVVCMDEKPYQLLGEARKPLPMRPGSDLKTDSEYVRNGTCSIFAFVEPLAGNHHCEAKEQRTAVDWAHQIAHLSDVVYPNAEKIILVCLIKRKGTKRSRKFPTNQTNSTSTPPFLSK